MNICDVCIIGAGPAGIAAAVQLKRYGIDALLFEKNQVGGLLHNANLIENYPGFPKGISGTSMVKKLCQHLESWDIDVVKEKVESLLFREDLFEIQTDCDLYHSRIVILASGTKPKYLDLPFRDNKSSELVYYEIHKLKGTRNKKIAIIGAGDAAFDYAINLARYNDVTIYNRGSKLSCLPLLYDRTMENPQITYLSEHKILSIESTHQGLKLTWKNDEKIVDDTADFLLIATGREPDCDYLKDLPVDLMNNLEKNGLIYRIGDLVNGIHRQTGIAVGDGIKAAMNIFEKLRELDAEGN